jgi:hypothetical protein
MGSAASSTFDCFVWNRGLTPSLGVSGIAPNPPRSSGHHLRPSTFVSRSPCHPPLLRLYDFGFYGHYDGSQNSAPVYTSASSLLNCKGTTVRTLRCYIAWQRRHRDADCHLCFWPRASPYGSVTLALQTKVVPSRAERQQRFLLANETATRPVHGN